MCGCSILPVNTSVRGPALPGDGTLRVFFFMIESIIRRVDITPALFDGPEEVKCHVLVVSWSFFCYVIPLTLLIAPYHRVYL